MKFISELNPHQVPLNDSMKNNLQVLFERLLEAQGAYGEQFQVTSGVRSDEFQAALIAQGKSSAIHSKHLAGAAADILDESGDLGLWVLDNLDALKNIGLWIEDPHHTRGWVHFQMMAPKSGKRVFIP